MRDMFYIAFSLFLLMDSIGNIPLFVACLKEVPEKNKKKIIFREMIIALLVIFLFTVIGNIVLDFLHLTPDTIRIAGGIILFLISLKMVFPSKSHHDDFPIFKEPLIVPLAVPLIAGPAVLASVMLYSNQYKISLVMGAILLSWFFSLLILLATPYLTQKLGKKGIMACERLMGLIMVLIAIQMFLEGLSYFIHAQCLLPTP